MYRKSSTQNAPKEKKKQPNLPIGAEKWLVDTTDRIRNQVEALNVHTGAYIIAKDVRTPANTPKNVRTHRNKRKVQNSPDK